MIEHGKDGWQLEDYAWNPETHIGRFEYQRTNEETKEVETAVRYRQQ